MNAFFIIFNLLGWMFEILGVIANPSSAYLTGQAIPLADTRWQTSATEESNVNIVSFPQTFRKGGVNHNF